MKPMWLLPLVLFCAALAHAGPFEGGHAVKINVEPGKTGTTVQKKFAGGQRACVIVKQQTGVAADVFVLVFDEGNQRVAEDTQGGPACAAIWYPPEDATYTIRIGTSSAEPINCYVSFK